jgi:hypothetical protein
MTSGRARYEARTGRPPPSAPAAAVAAALRGARVTAAATFLLAVSAVAAEAPVVVAPLTGPGANVPAPWRFEGLPEQTLPATRFDLVDLDGRRVLRVTAEGSYGNLVHPLPDAGDGPGAQVAQAAAAPTLSWRWRVEQPVAGADLRTKAGDDTAVKVCALFDLPLDALPFWERQTMRLARSLSGQDLPAATLCYVWDATLAPGTVLPNAHSPRLRWWVLRGPESSPGQWLAERRDLRADFLRAFGDEASEMPPLRAIGVGADADNTGARGLAYVDALALAP